jgi:hypothetical protein
VTQDRQPLRLWRLTIVTAAVAATLVVLDRVAGLPVPSLADWTPRVDLAAAVVPERDKQSGLPIMSLVMAPADLNDPARGILSNVLQHGRAWERPGSIAFFHDGTLRFASGVGVRVHGGGSRITSPRQGFRLYFRRQYGANRVPAGVLFGADAQPIQRLIIHNDLRSRWSLVNPLAYDIADAIGAIAPDTLPVRFFLNGEYYGVFVLTERFDERFFAAHWGRDDVRVEQADFDVLWDWTRKTRPLTMAAVAEQVNLENLTRWFLAVAFCATGDAYQGPGQFLDLSRERSPWFWVNWDMDGSFREWDLDAYRYLLNPPGRIRRGRNRAESRSTILTHLFAEDDHYRTFYKRIFVAAMNHHLTPEFLNERYEHYRATAVRLGVTNLAYLKPLRTFFDRRVPFFRTTTEQWLNTGPSQPMVLAAPPGETVTIDGEKARDGFEGLYFPDLEIELRALGDGGGTFMEWRVNGQSAGRTPRVRLIVGQPTRVEAVFEGPQAPSLSRQLPAVLDRRPRPPVDTSAPPLAWVPASPPTAGDQAPAVGRGFPQQLMMLAHEVSAAAFAAFVAKTGGRMPTQPSWFATPDHPVVNVTWDEAQAFCASEGGRLPTEAEWRYAARAGQAGDHPFPWGDTFSGEANLAGTTGAGRRASPAPVGSLPPNRYGLFGMIGNAWEWTADQHESSTVSYDVRTVLGGSWDQKPRSSQYRTGLSRRGRHNLYVEFRCVRWTPRLPAQR